MDLYEYQARQMFKEHGVPVLDYRLASTPEEAREGARELLADVGFDPVLGARPLRRAIQREIEDALSERILFGELQPGQVVTVGVTGEGKERKFTFNGE